MEWTKGVTNSECWTTSASDWYVAPLVIFLGILFEKKRQ